MFCQVCAKGSLPFILSLLSHPKVERGRAPTFENQQKYLFDQRNTWGRGKKKTMKKTPGVFSKSFLFS